MSETHLVSQVIRALAAIPRCVFWRNNVGAIRKRGGVLRFGLGAGSADVVGIVWPGRLVALECKTLEGKLSARQISWRNSVIDCGGRYWTVRSVSDAIEAVNEARKG